MEKGNLYPSLVIENIKNPNKFYAFPVIGFLAKIILLIPIVVEFIFLGLFLLAVMFINSWVVVFSGKYWQFAYRYNLGLIRLSTKIKLYFYGLTDKYPYFNFAINDRYSLDMPCPEHPGKLYAVPFFGGLIRLFMLIPYLVFDQVIGSGALAGFVVSFYNVLSKNEFPESIFEFERDAIRISQASAAYFLGLSDDYPSFYLSMDHQTIKIALIITGIILTTSQGFSYKANDHHNPAPTPTPMPIPIARQQPAA